jgi:hypothetical protein
MAMFEAFVAESPETAAKLLYWTKILLTKADPTLTQRLVQVAERLKA